MALCEGRTLAFEEPIDVDINFDWPELHRSLFSL